VPVLRHRFCRNRWHAGRPLRNAGELADTVAAQWTGIGANRYVVLTGGEPLLQVDKALVDALHARGFEIGIETNGTIEPPRAWTGSASARKPAPTS